MKVLHLLRKQAQLNSTFIRNQIIAGMQSQCMVAFYERSIEFSDMKLKSENAEIEIVSLHTVNSVFNYCYYRMKRIIDPDARRILYDIIDRYKPDIIHLHYGTDAGIFLPVLNTNKIPKFVSFYGYDAFSFPRRFMGLGKIYLQKRVFSNATVILAMTDVMAEDLRKLGCEDSKIHIHYHGVPASLSSMKRSYLKDGTIQLLMLSYLDPVKGHGFVLRALKILVDNGLQNFHLNIFGDGHYRRNIETDISNLNLAHFVTIHGKINYLSVEYYRAFELADIFLHPSITTRDDKEGVPGALVEAMFSALPSVATFHGGIPCVIDNGQTGILVGENDTQELASAIQMLMLDSKLRQLLGQKARCYALEYLDIKKRQMSLESFFAAFC